MNEKNKENIIFKNTDFWKNEIKKAGFLEKLNFFNDVIIENRPPHEKSNYGNPVLRDVVLDGKIVDIYHSDHIKHDTYHRIFIHIKDKER